MGCLAVAVAAAAAEAQGAVLINEVMAANDSVMADEDGDFSDWIELLNTGPQEVPLGGWGLSNDPAAPFLWTFPSLTVLPGGRLLVWASKKDRKPAAVLENNGLLIAAGTSWKYWDAGAVPAGLWRETGYDDAAWPTGTARFGTPLAAGGTALAKSPANQFYPSYFFRKAFALSAVPASNEFGVVQLRHHFDDGAVVSINGTEVYRYKMPEGEVSYTNYTGDGYNVDGNGFWVTNALDKALVLSLLHAGTNVCAVSLHQSKATSSDALFDLGLWLQSGTNRALHTNFKVSASGCDVYLTDAGGTRVDHVAVPVMPADYSAGRSPDGGGAWRVFATATPGAANGAVSYAGVVAAPAVSAPPGFYADPVAVSLSTATPDAAIYYTTDGSTPTTNALRYAGPLTLLNRSLLPNGLSLTNTGSGPFSIPAFGAVSNYLPPTGLVPKANVLRAIAARPDWKDSPLTGGTWFVGPETAAFSVPVVSLASDVTNFFGPRGIYSNPSTASTYDWEYPLNVELFADGQSVANQLMGFRIHGGFSSSTCAEKTLRLYARSDYGAASFGYALFPEQPQFDSYKRFLLRNGGNDWPRTMLRDVLAQELVKHLGFDTQAYRPAAVFLNGEYWGVHQLRERYDGRYLERTYGVDPDNVDLIGFQYGGTTATADEGTAADYNAMLAWLGANTLSNAAAYAAITARVDVANFADYELANIFVINKDWPANNIKFWRVHAVDTNTVPVYGHDGRWRWLMYDADFAFLGWDKDPVHENMWAWAASTSGSGRVTEPAARLFRRLLENGGFRTNIVSRYADLLNTTYRPWRVRALLDSLRDGVGAEMPRHVMRWPGGITSMTAWTNELERVYLYAQERYSWEWRNLCTRFGLTNALISVHTPQPQFGAVQVNSVVVDSRTPGLPDASAPYPWTGVYFRGIPVKVCAVPKSGCRFVRWAETGVTNAVLSVALSNDVQTLTAEFEPDPAVQAGRAVYLPPGEDNWDLNSCWSTGVFPNWPGAVAVIPAPTELDEDGLPRRNVRVNSAPVTVGRIEVENGAYNNRIRNKKDAAAGSSLTFDGGGVPAVITVLGSEAGFTTVEMTYGVVLATDVRLVVSNTVGDAQYGGLRLQAGWSGGGGLIKEGPGICSLTGEGKAYAGATRIREGVLALTAPATPTNTAGVAVEPGGQLRLTSGTLPGEPPREYAFGGAVALASRGRSGFDGVPGAGAKGGLRYDPDGSTNRAILRSPVSVSEASCIHVESAGEDAGAINTLELSGPLSGGAPLLKSGEGRLTLSGGASDMEGAVTLGDGVLNVMADLREADVAMDDASAVLTGCGRVGAISGNGWVSPGEDVGTLTAQSVGGGADFAFRFTAAGAETNGNDVLLLTYTEAPFANVLGPTNRIAVYFDALPPSDGFALGGFRTSSPADFTRFVALAEWQFFVADESGPITFGGRSYAACTVPLNIETVEHGAGRMLKITRPAHGYSAWCAAQFTLAERADPLISGPLAKGPDGVENLMRYALGIGRGEPIGPYLPQFSRSGGAWLYSFRSLAAADREVDYLVVSADDLRAGTESWQDVFEVDGLTVRLLAPEATGDPAVEITTVEIVPTAAHPVRFFRLRVVAQ